MSKRLLIDERPILVTPGLAVRIGLNEAIFTQQMHYWLDTQSGKEILGRRWIYNTYSEWNKQFPFWSDSTLRRTVYSLERQGILLSRTETENNGIRKYYSLDYDIIDKLSS